MSVAETSLKAFENKVKPDLEGRKKEVYNALEKIGPATMHQVADHTGKRLNQISGRFGEKELLGTHIKKVCETQEGRSLYKVKKK